MAFNDINFTGYWDATNNVILNSPPGGARVLIDRPSTNPVLYLVIVAGATSLGGITDWRVGDWAVNLGFGWYRFLGNTPPIIAALNAAVQSGALPFTPGGANPHFWLNGSGDGTGVLEFS